MKNTARRVGAPRGAGGRAVRPPRRAQGRKPRARPPQHYSKSYQFEGLLLAVADKQWPALAGNRLEPYTAGLG